MILAKISLNKECQYNLLRSAFNCQELCFDGIHNAGVHEVLLENTIRYAVILDVCHFCSKPLRTVQHVWFTPRYLVS